MAFFTNSEQDKNIETTTLMSDRELKNAIIARIMESNAWEMHKNQHKDAKLSTIEDDKGLSEFEKSVMNNPEKRPDRRGEESPIINYDSAIHKFTATCNCGKEKFIFNMKDDSVRTEGQEFKMKELDPYKKNDGSDQQYGRPQGEGNPTYSNKQAMPSAGYNNSKSDSGLKYKN